MGWKTFKEHYRITHAVQVTSKGICIGSPYCHDLIIVGDDMKPVMPHTSLGTNVDLTRYIMDMEADTDTLRRVIKAHDTFARDLLVYTYDGADISAKYCEDYGWPNVTHDGLMMYENRFSPDLDQVIAWAKNNARAGVELQVEALSGLRTKIAERRDRLALYLRNLENLEAWYPTKKDATA